jgi:hypothetical protein
MLPSLECQEASQADIDLECHSFATATMALGWVLFAVVSLDFSFLTSVEKQ